MPSEAVGKSLPLSPWPLEATSRFTECFTFVVIFPLNKDLREELLYPLERLCNLVKVTELGAPDK
jgi:hypothetical protein